MHKDEGTVDDALTGMSASVFKDENGQVIKAIA
jgi:hypothetical protein